MKLTPELQQKIDGMSQIEMAKLWRFAPYNEPLMQGECGNYFLKVFGEKGGMTPSISKAIGW